MSSVYGRGGDIDAAVLAATNIGGQAGLAQKVELSLKCEELADMDTFSKSDPFCILYKLVKGQRNQVAWSIVGKTEVIHDNLNPQFIKKMLVDYHFEQSDRYKIEVYDSDDDSQ